MRELYADFNNFTSDRTLPLDCAGSMASIARLQVPLRDGEEVWLTDGELGTRAHVFFRSEGYWEARSAWEFVPTGAVKP